MNVVFRQFGTVTANELVDSVRSRRALVLLFLYLVGAIVGCALFIQVLHKVEVKLVESIGLTASSDPGEVTRTLWESSNFRHIMEELVGDDKLAAQLLDVPPLGIFYGWLSFFFTPLLVVLMSSPRIAEEVSTASVRFVLFRTRRSTWCAGKYAGQAVLLLGALSLSALGAWVTGYVRMKGFDPGSNAIAMGGFVFKAWVYSLAYLGLALGVSQCTRSPVIATGLGLVAMVGLTTIAGVSNHFKGEGWRQVLEITLKLTPRGNNLGLWNPELAHFLPALVFLPALGLLYFSLGHIFFSRRDQ